MKPSFTKLDTLTLIGIEPHLVTCEVALSLQIPNITLVGLPSSMTHESCDRIRSAVLNSGLDWPARKITINLLPASLPKWGSHFELAMALGVLLAGSKLETHFNILALGELSLSGEVRPTIWAQSMSEWLIRFGINQYKKSKKKIVFIGHEDDLNELKNNDFELEKYFIFISVKNLKNAFEKIITLIEVSDQNHFIEVNECRIQNIKNSSNLSRLAQVKGEPLAVLGSIVSIAGKFHTLFAGPQGSGKSMLIKSICEAGQPLSLKEMHQRKAYYGLFGEAFFQSAETEFARPVVYLQTSATRAAMEGSLLNNGQIIPGECTRAHAGVLVIDELLEFRRDSIECLRQPLEEKIIRLQRARYKTVLPAKFQLLSSTNLCSCGFFGINEKKCRCGKVAVKSYLKKLSGPLLDRFDLILLVGMKQEYHFSYEANKLLLDICDSKNWEKKLDEFKTTESENDQIFLNNVHLPEYLSHRGREKVLSVAKVIASLDGKKSNKCLPEHVELALNIRQNIEGILETAIFSYG